MNNLNFEFMEKAKSKKSIATKAKIVKKSNNFEVYTHSKTLDGRRFTLCASVKEIDAKTCSIEFGLAICNEKDNFCKKIGRQISLGRISAGKKLEVSEFGVDSKLSINNNSYAETRLRLHKVTDILNSMKSYFLPNPK